MSLRQIIPALVRVLISVLGGGLFYSVWLAGFLVSRPSWQIILWFLSPLVTALGYAVGIILGERLTRVSPTRFIRVFIWPLVGCIIGAGIVVWFGPMLIVFGMFGLGTAGIVLKEWLVLRQTRGAGV